MDISTNKKKMMGYIMAVIGFIIILYNAFNYIFGWKLDLPSSAIGIIFLAIGTGYVRKSSKTNIES